MKLSSIPITRKAIDPDDRKKMLQRVYSYLLSIPPPDPHESEPADDDLGRNTAASSQVETSACADGTASTDSIDHQKNGGSS
jgi:hypothetical protein